MASAAGGSIERVSVLGELRAIAAGGGRLQSDYEAWEALKVRGGSSVLPATLGASWRGGSATARRSRRSASAGRAR